jgi:hypothetical protein
MTRFSTLIPSEHDEQVVFMRHIFYTMPQIEPFLFAIPNGGLRNKTTAARLKAEGVKPGVPDLFLSLPSGTYHGLYIEMKRSEGGKLSPEQKEMLDRFGGVGYMTVVANGADEALDAVKEYLEVR